MKYTQRQVVKYKLKNDGEITNVWAMQNGIFRLSERCRELQKEGMEIEGSWVRNNGRKTGTYRYVLKKRIPETKWILDENTRIAKKVVI